MCFVIMHQIFSMSLGAIAVLNVIIW